VDLDGPFSLEDFGGEPFDAVVAAGIIEHVENPTGFLRRCRTLIRPDGRLFLDLPDVGSLNARFQYLRHGYPPTFGTGPARELGHINPLPEPTLRVLFERTGWEVLHHNSVGHAVARGLPARVRLWLRGMFLHPLRVLMANRPTRGRDSIYLLRPGPETRP